VRHDIRLTPKVAAVLATLGATPTEPWHGYDIAKAARVGTATIYSILGRLEDARLVEGVWEQIDPRVEKRPARRLYRLTAAGQTAADVARGENPQRATHIALRAKDLKPGLARS
jgi:PadR family transcriptional regulator, regulatory protein PadR